MRRLDKDEEILRLERILVKDNKQVVGVRILRGYMGMGGTNRSGFEPESIQEYTLEQLGEKEPIWVKKSEICAVVNDVLYFRCQDGDGDGKKQVYTMDHREKERTMVGDSIAYDTVSASKVVLLLAQD